jgi:SAM-dependent methyltransferase
MFCSKIKLNGELIMSYRQYINAIEIDRNARILEVGPLNRPIIDKARFPNAVYCDIRTTEEIKALYTSNDYLSTTSLTVPIEEIVDIDFVINESYKKTFSNVPKFDYIVSSHVFEHVENIILTLQDISTILAPNGRLIIYYPDIRYCFDHFRAEASFRDAYDVFINGRPALARMAMDFYYSAISENRAPVFWLSKSHHDLMPANDMTKAIEAFERTYNGELMDDVHYWPFSDAGFIKFLYDLVRSDLLCLTSREFYPTQINTQEFLLVLENNEMSWNKDEALLILQLQYDAAYNA